MKNFFIGLLLIVSSLASANNLPTKLDGLSFPLPSSEATAKQKEEIYKNLYSAIQQVAYGSVLLPKSLNVYAIKTYENAFYFPFAGTIVTPYQLVVEGASKHPKFTRGVDLHEYAHSIFEANLPVMVRNNEEFSNVVESFSKIKGSFKKEAITMLGFMVASELAVKTPNEERMSTEYANAEMKFGEAAQMNEEIISYYIELGSFLSPLNEFFADVFAVAITNDSEVVKKAIEFTAHANAKQNDRSFSLRPGKRKLTFSPHDFYSLSRYHIYRNYLSNPEVRLKGPRWIMTKTIESVRCALDSQIAREEEFNAGYAKAKNEEQYTVETFNRFLNECIDYEFQK